MSRCLLAAIFSITTLFLPSQEVVAQGNGAPKKPRSFAPNTSGLGGQATNQYNPSGNSDWGQQQSQSQQGQFQSQPQRQQNRSLGGTIGSAVMNELFQDYPQNNNWNGQQNGRPPKYQSSPNYSGYGGMSGNSYQPNSYNTNGWGNGYQQGNSANGYYQNSNVAPYSAHSHTHTHVVTRPAPPSPRKTYSNKPIRLFVPEDEVGNLAYQLLADSEIYDYEMEPGSEQEFPHDRDYKVTYDRGDGQRLKYQIVGGTSYKFKKDSSGFWQLYAVAQ